MLSINQTYFYIFLYVLLIQIPCLSLLFFLDELGLVFLIGLIFLDLCINGAFKRYKHLYIVIGILAFYALYSIFVRKFNIVPAILNDFIIQMKPFIPFFATYAIVPSFTNTMKSVLKITSITIASILLLSFLTNTVYYIVGHVAYLGIITFNCFLVYLYCSIRGDGSITSKDLCISIIILLIGLTSTRAKFYGEFIFALYFLFIYKPGIIKRMQLKQLLLLIATIVITIIATWNKIEFYFIFGNADTFEIENLVSYARPILYGTMALILLDYPLLGSGLASFATASSAPAVNYSLVYSQYGIDNIWGLSKQMPDFICDAFFPELAQFGFIGIGLFIYFFVWIYQKLRIVLYCNKLQYTVGVLAIIYIMIESTTGSVLVQAGGMLAMMILGMIASQANNYWKNKIEIQN